MKKLLFIILALTCVTISKAVLISPPPTIELTEFGFESNGNWIIELEYNNIWNNNNYMPIDSIFISTSAGSSKLRNLRFEDVFGKIIVRVDSLLSNLNISPEGDSIQIEYYYSFAYETKKNLAEAVVFGNYRNATLKAPKMGESIASYSVFTEEYTYNNQEIYKNIFSIDKLPNFGIENDSIGMCGTLKGKIYDKNNQLLTNSTLQFYTKEGIKITYSADGSYSARVFSNEIRLSQIFSKEKYNHSTIDIVPIDLDFKPDIVVTKDIHIDLITGIDEVNRNAETLLKVFPNPIKDLSFNYEISIPVKSSSSYIELINIVGQKIAQFPILEATGKINLPANTINGMYTLRLMVNNKNYAFTKIIIDGK